MPINIPDNLPAIDILRKEKIFIMKETRALSQDVRPLKIVIMNIMPTKITTETHILRLLSNTPLQMEVELLHPQSHKSRNTSTDHLRTFYKCFNEIKGRKYDGMIITGAPVELLEFEEVDYWEEMKEIMDWSVDNVTSTLFICWAAQAALYNFFGIPKYPLKEKMFGVFHHRVNTRDYPIVRGFDDTYLAPHSHHTEVRAEDIRKVKELEIISESDEAGVYLVQAINGKQIFVTGHSEYDPDTLKGEYERDLKKGLDIAIPRNYFPEDDPVKPLQVRWRSHANLLFTNWLNYYVYQVTPYDLNMVSLSAKVHL